jgi:fructokinase
MNSKAPIVVGLGEVLWDFLPTGRQLGGAPANFAYISRVLGCQSVIASRVGTDELGSAAIATLGELGLSGDHVQVDTVHPTGRVLVEIDDGGEPEFEIVESVAWDFLEWSESWRQLALTTDAVCFGSLAQRSPQSRETIRNFLGTMRRESTRVFDVNLRQSFYSADVISESLKMASIAKLNHDELPIVTNLLGLETADEERAARKLLDAFDLELVCVTRGANGSLLVNRAESDEHSGLAIRVVDTVGAGDAFTAGLVHEYLRGASLQAMNGLANRMGAWVSSQPGAMPSSANLPTALNLPELDRQQRSR